MRGSPGLRVIVVSTSLAPSDNELWEAARKHVSQLELVGAERPGDVVPESTQLREFDFGKGLIWRHLVGLRKLIRQRRPDLVHVNGEVWGVTAQEVIGLPTRVVVHGAENLWEHGGRLEAAMRSRLVTRAVRHLDGYASWNDSGARYIETSAERSGRSFPVWSVPAIIPPAVFWNARWSPPPISAATPFEILVVGRLVPEKGVQDVVRAAARLATPVRVTVSGEGGLVDELKRLAAAEGVPLVATGHLDPAALADRMARAHVLVQASRTTPCWAEQFGRSVAEAMAVGLPVVVSDSGELPRVVGVADAVFPEGDIRSLAHMLDALTGSPDRMRQLAAEECRSAARFSPRVASEDLVTFWSHVMEK